MNICGKFVVQRHRRAGGVHWDWMFEAGDVLETWRVEAKAENLSNQAVSAVKIFDHDLKFLTYQGSVNKGTGTVKITDQGTYQVIAEYENGCEIELAGEIVKGKVTIRSISGDKWEFLFS